MIKCKVGQQVYVDADSGLCTSSWATVTDIKVRYDEVSGERYNLIVCNKSEFRGDTGDCVKGGTASYLSGSVR